VLILACLPGRDSRSSSPPPADTAATDASVAPVTECPPSSTVASPARPLQAIYIVSSCPFAEVEDFVEESAVKYHLDLKRYALPMRPALEAYSEDKPAVKAIFLGTRRTDPHGEFLTHFDPTDAGWPQFMRVHPVIDWHYVEIWAVSHYSLFPWPSGLNGTWQGTWKDGDSDAHGSSFGTSKSRFANCTTGGSPP
jgi:FAD synthetase